MSGNGAWTARACCARAAACGRALAFTERSGATPTIAAVEAPVIAENLPQPAREPRLAFHEAGHSVIAALLGAEVQGARIGGGDSATIAFEADAPRASRAAMSLAGPIAEAWSARWVIRQGDEDLRWYRDRIRDADIGNCDRCRAMFWTIGENSRRDEAETFARYREIEAQTIETVKRRDVWNSIKRVADALLEHGEIDGGRIKALADCEPININ